jgi:hypothetical protein
MAAETVHTFAILREASSSASKRTIAVNVPPSSPRFKGYLFRVRFHRQNCHSHTTRGGRVLLSKERQRAGVQCAANGKVSRCRCPRAPGFPVGWTNGAPYHTTVAIHGGDRCRPQHEGSVGNLPMFLLCSNWPINAAPTSRPADSDQPPMPQEIWAPADHSSSGSERCCKSRGPADVRAQCCGVDDGDSLQG